MFQSYQYLNYLGYNEDTEEYKWQYKIIDTDFEEVGVAVAVAVGVAVVVAVGVAVIDTYEKRGLNVPSNLIKAILWYHKQFPHISIQQIIEDNKKYNPKFSKYEKDIEKDIEKYMVLM